MYSFDLVFELFMSGEGGGKSEGSVDVSEEGTVAYLESGADWLKEDGTQVYTE